MRIKKITRKILFILLIMFFGGLGGVVIDKYIFPYLATKKFFSRYEFLKKSTENTTYINKTEQVFVKEETSAEKIASLASSSVVGIISYPDPAIKNPQAQSKKGTGTIATSDGLILTHSEAINLENSKYKVITAQGNTYDASLEGRDSYSNLVFLKISASNLPVASFRNSDEEKAGEKIVILGYGTENFPFQFNSGLLSSIDSQFSVSGKNIASSEALQGIFKTDSSLKKDFVGGPVADYSGQIIGIVGSAISEKGETYFILPSNKVKKVIDKAIKKDLPNNSILGIYYLPLNRDLAIQKNLETQKGALIYSASGQRGLAIIAGSPADKAGLLLGDIILKVDAEEVAENNSLSDILYQHKKGDEITLTILRDKKEQEVKVKL